jgi:hypothetical protein
MVFQVASAIAESQVQLDKASVDILTIMGDMNKAPVSIPIWDDKGAEKNLVTSMIGAGFQPTFYQFSDAIIEVKMAITMSTEEMSEDKETTERGPSTTTEVSLNRGRLSVKRTKIKSSTINATYTNKYNFSEEASSLLRVRLVPLPPNPIIQRLIELRAQKQQMEIEAMIKAAEKKLQTDMDNKK